MNKNRFFVWSTAFAALVATGFVIKTDPAIAQQVVEKAQETIVVEAPIVRHQVMQSRTTGASTEVIELRRRVSYADLELGNQSDVAELETRIEATAKDACKKLSDMFPLSPSDRDEIRRCTNQAVDGAKEVMQEAIAAAS